MALRCHQSVVIPAKAGIYSVDGAFSERLRADSPFRAIDDVAERPSLANDTAAGCCLV